MKRVFLLFLSLSICVSCLKDEAPNDTTSLGSGSSYMVTLQEARAELETILMELSTETKAEQEGMVRTIEYGYSLGNYNTRVDENQEPFVHIFNFENDEGFAIMSGDRRVTPLLALTLDGSLPQDTIVDNPGLAIFLANAESYYISEMQKQGATPIQPSGNIEFLEDGSVVYHTWKTYNYVMTYGNCKVQWGQGAPYNSNCPIMDDGKQALTGCLATAAAQLMATYHWPDNYTGYSFDWDIMTAHTKASSCGSLAQYQIAVLMRQLGNSENLDMDYGSDKSSAYSSNFPRTLQNFGYSNGGKLIDYNTSNVINELRTGNCVLLSGKSQRTLHKETFLGITVNQWYTYSGGHGWLAHGLMRREYTREVYKDGVCIESEKQDYWYPLCNLGWNGKADGFYLSGVFDTNKGPDYEWSIPSSIDNCDVEVGEEDGEPHNYQFQIKAVVGIRK